MRGLTPFQEQTEAGLHAALACAHMFLEHRVLEGQNETFVRAIVSGTLLEVLIYDDGASLQGPGIDVRFEAADYTSAEQLAKAFVAATVAHAEQHQQDN